MIIHALLERGLISKSSNLLQKCPVRFSRKDDCFNKNNNDSPKSPTTPLERLIDKIIQTTISLIAYPITQPFRVLGIARDLSNRITDAKVDRFLKWYSKHESLVSREKSNFIENFIYKARFAFWILFGTKALVKATRHLDPGSNIFDYDEDDRSLKNPKRPPPCKLSLLDKFILKYCFKTKPIWEIPEAELHKLYEAYYALWQTSENVRERKYLYAAQDILVNWKKGLPNN